MNQQFFVIELTFNAPEQVAAGLNLFFQTHAQQIEDIIAISNYVTAHQETPGLSLAGKHPSVKYVFRYVITYTGTQIVNDQLN